jgi:hypothetical protein
MVKTAQIPDSFLSSEVVGGSGQGAVDKKISKQHAVSSMLQQALAVLII